MKRENAKHNELVEELRTTKEEHIYINIYIYIYIYTYIYIYIYIYIY